MIPIKSAFISVYKRVFDQDNNIRVCGREVTSRLIGYADELEPGISHGDTKTGFINQQAMIDLYTKIIK